MFINEETPPENIPEEYIRLSFAYLESAERLNSEIESSLWCGNFHRGQVVLWLSFQATELFLKGCILKLSSSEKVQGHILPVLASRLNELMPELNFQVPFKSLALPTDEAGFTWEKKQDRVTHESLKYPTDHNSQPWQGLRMYSPTQFGETLRALRAQVECAKNVAFPAADG